MATGRFAPSPTGPLHLGNLRTALLAWLFARDAGSRFLVRIEDLDTAARPAIEARQLADLVELGLDWDGPVVRQSERGDRYAAAIDRLDGAGLLYRCYCTRREIHDAPRAPHQHLPDGAYPGTCSTLDRAGQRRHERAGRRPALRLRAGGLTRTVFDRLHGEHSTVVDDFVVRRNDGVVAYNLAVVVDDADQRVEEVVRGHDLLVGTPRQILLAELLDLDPPAYAHVPLVCGPDGARLAKRDGAVTLADQRARGRTASQVRGLLATSLGLAAAGETLSMAELLDRFDPEALPREPWRVPRGLL